jgi:hypothetical protein
MLKETTVINQYLNHVLGPEYQIIRLETFDVYAYGLSSINGMTSSDGGTRFFLYHYRQCSLA